MVGWDEGAGTGTSKVRSVANNIELLATHGVCVNAERRRTPTQEWAAQTARGVGHGGCLWFAAPRGSILCHRLLLMATAARPMASTLARNMQSQVQIEMTSATCWPQVNNMSLSSALVISLLMEASASKPKDRRIISHSSGHGAACCLARPAAPSSALLKSEEREGALRRLGRVAALRSRRVDDRRCRRRQQRQRPTRASRARHTRQQSQRQSLRRGDRPKRLRRRWRRRSPSLPAAPHCPRRLAKLAQAAGGRRRPRTATSRAARRRSAPSASGRWRRCTTTRCI